MQENASALAYASAELRADLSMALPAVSHDGLLLQFLPEDLKSNMEVVRTAVAKNVRAFEFARGNATELGQLAATEVLNSLGVENEDPVSALVIHARDVCAMCFDSLVFSMLYRPTCKKRTVGLRSSQLVPSSLL